MVLETLVVTAQEATTNISELSIYQRLSVRMSLWVLAAHILFFSALNCSDVSCFFPGPVSNHASITVYIFPDYFLNKALFLRLDYNLIDRHSRGDT